MEIKTSISRHLKQGRIAKRDSKVNALKSFNKAINLAEQNNLKSTLGLCLLERCAIYMEEKKYDEVLHDLRVIEIQKLLTPPLYAAYYTINLSCTMAKGDSSGADEIVNNVNMMPSVRELMDWQWAEKVSHLLQYQKILPQAENLVTANQHKVAKYILFTALDLMPTLEAKCLLAECWAHEHGFNAADKLIKDVMKVDADYSATVFANCVIRFYKGQLYDCLLELDRFMVHNPHHVRARNLHETAKKFKRMEDIAQKHTYDGNHSAASDVYSRQCIVMDPSYAYFHLQLGLSLGKENKIRQSLECSFKVYNVGFKTENALLLHADNHYYMNEYEAAKVIYEELEKMYPHVDCSEQKRRCQAKIAAASRQVPPQHQPPPPPPKSHRAPPSTSKSSTYRVYNERIQDALRTLELPLNITFTEAQVKKAYRSACKKYHTDKNPGLPAEMSRANDECFIVASEAKTVLLEHIKSQ